MASSSCGAIDNPPGALALLDEEQTVAPQKEYESVNSSWLAA
jgi:hypothetical protein